MLPVIICAVPTSRLATNAVVIAAVCIPAVPIAAAAMAAFDAVMLLAAIFPAVTTLDERAAFPVVIEPDAKFAACVHKAANTGLVTANACRLSVETAPLPMRAFVTPAAAIPNSPDTTAILAASVDNIC